MKNFKAIILIVLVFSLLFLAACEEGKTTDGSGAIEEKKTGEGAKLSDILSKRTHEYMVKYKIESSANGVKNSNTVSWYIKGNDKMKWNVESAEGSATYYKIGNEAYMCSKTDGKETCLKMDIPEQTNSPEKDLNSIADETKYSTIFSGTKTIAGAVAFCYEVTLKTGANAGVKSESCISKEGIPLYTKVETAQVTSTMEATEFSTSVADSEFVVPAGAQDLTALAQQYQQQAGSA